MKKPGGESLLLVDVREPHEWAAGRLPGSVHIPLATLPQRLGEIGAGLDAGVHLRSGWPQHGGLPVCSGTGSRRP